MGSLLVTPHYVYPVCCEADVLYVMVNSIGKSSLPEGNLDNLSANTISFPGLYIIL